MYALKIILLVENNPFFPSIAKALRGGGQKLILDILGMSKNINILGISDQLEIEVIVITKYDWCTYKNI